MTGARLYRIADADGETQIVLEENGAATVIDAPHGVLALLRAGIATPGGLMAHLHAHRSTRSVSAEWLSAARTFRLPIEHHDAAHCMVTGTGLTHPSSAMTRDRMSGKEGASDSLKMYEWGLERGKPAGDEIGIQPEWFFKGSGSCLVPSGGSVAIPGFAGSFGEEPEIAGVYLIDDHGQPQRIGYLLANDFSDHRLEERNYLYVAPSKLHLCGIGPALVLGDLPADIRGETCIHRDGAVHWRGAFATGEANMNHSFANLEHHHFKHATLLRPGDVHIHLFGCPRFSFGDGISLLPGDTVEVSVPEFGPPMRHAIVRTEAGERRVHVRSAAL